jgi:hypothetical protein
MPGGESLTAIRLGWPHSTPPDSDVIPRIPSKKVLFVGQSRDKMPEISEAKTLGGK